MSAPPARSGEATPPWRLIGLIFTILAVRLALAAHLHLTEDEAYYRLWSMAPALGYYDHPPMIAWWVAAGRLVAGDTPLGVRLAPCLASALTSLLVFDMARLSGAATSVAERASLWFNATLLALAGGFLAVPDAPAALFWSLTLWCLLRAQASDGGRWWVGAGCAAGLAALSKYSALFLGPGVLLWLLATPGGRARLRSPGPWLALAIAAGLFALNIAWNAQHHWPTFAKQFGRIAPSGFAPRYLGELIATQLLLANPVIVLFLVRGAVGRRNAWWPSIRPFVTTSAPFVIYLVLHSLHDRVQPHWPAPVYPALVIVAALTAEGLVNPIWLRLRRSPVVLAVAVAASLLGLILAPPSLFALGGDPLAPVRGWTAFARAVDRVRAASGASWVGTASYGLASQLADERKGFPLLQISERDRWRSVTTGRVADFTRPGLIVDLPRRLDFSNLRRCFGAVERLPDIPRGAAGERAQIYADYLVARPSRDVIGQGCGPP